MKNTRAVIRKMDWIIRIECSASGPKAPVSIELAQEALVGLDVTITAVEQAIACPTIQLYAKAPEQAIHEYAMRLKRTYDLPSFRVEVHAEKRVRVSRRREKPVSGDVFAVPLPQGYYGYVRMLQEVSEDYKGHAIEYLDITTSGRLATIDECRAASVFLEPTITMINIGISHFGWIKIGSIKRESPPLRFRASLMWFLTDSESHTDWRVLEPGKGWIKCGMLPESYRSLPQAGCNPPPVMAERIAAAKGIANDGIM